MVLLFYFSYPIIRYMLDELDPQQIALLIAEVQSEPWQHYDELGQ